MEHHPLLHRALIVARLFQEQVAAESYPPGKVEISLAFDGGSSHANVTREFAVVC
jgi:hypothetical protein